MAAASSSFSITQEELNLFHYIDRQLYTILVMHLWRNPAESLQVMALWLWLESISFENVVHKILCLPYTLVNELADEAVLCLNIIKNTTSTNNNAASSSEADEVPMTQCLMKKDISIQFFHENRYIATHGIGQVMNEICNRALLDIMQEAVRRNAAQSMAESQNMMANPSKQPGCPPQTVVGQPEQQQIWGTPEPGVICPEDRTILVTFSKGYPVTEREVREFFTRSHGDCIESFHMQEVQQVPFARIVFKSTATIDGILNGMSKIKFAINGKAVSFRKFVPKNLAMPATELPMKFSFEFPPGF